MRVLIVADNIDFQTSSGAKANWAFARSLAFNNRNKVKVLHYSLKDLSSSVMELVEIKENRRGFYFYSSRLQRVIRRNFGIDLPKYINKYSGFDHTFKNDVQSIVSYITKENPSKYDLLITLSQGAQFMSHAAVLKRQEWHHKWLAYMHDPFPMCWYPEPYNWVEPGYKKKKHFIISVANKAKCIGYPSKRLADWMGQFENAFKAKSIILRHQSIEVKNSLKNQQAYFSENKFVVLHSGNLLKQRDPFPLIEAWTNFLKNNPNASDNAKLVFLGNGEYHEPELSEMCSKYSILRISKNIDYEIARQLESRSTINVILEAKAEISPFLPAKFTGLVLANKIILHLGPKNSEVLDILGSSYEWHSSAGNVAAICDCLSKLYDKWKKGNSLTLDRNDILKEISPEKLNKMIYKSIGK